jgi:hypothetical protein
MLFVHLTCGVSFVVYIPISANVEICELGFCFFVGSHNQCKGLGRKMGDGIMVIVEWGQGCYVYKCFQLSLLCHTFKRLSIIQNGAGIACRIIVIMLPLNYTAIINP